MHYRNLIDQATWLERRIAELEARPVIMWEGQPLLGYHIQWLRGELRMCRAMAADARAAWEAALAAEAEREAALAAEAKARRSAILEAARKARKNAKARAARAAKRRLVADLAA